MPHLTITPRHRSRRMRSRTRSRTSGRRPELWPNLNAKLFEVHSVDGTQADVTEGSSFLGGIWERLLRPANGSGLPAVLAASLSQPQSTRHWWRRLTRRSDP